MISRPNIALKGVKMEMKYQIVCGTLLIVLPVLSFNALLSKIATDTVNVMYVLIGMVFVSISVAWGVKMIKKINMNK